jgi:hypothetical protein
MKTTYRVLAYLIATGVPLQAAFIAFVMFGVWHDVDAGQVIDQSYEANAGALLHGITGMMVIPLLAIVFLIVSFFARIRGGVTWAGIVLGVVFLQVTLAFVAFGAEVVGLLHGFNALVLFAVALYAGLRVTRTRTAQPRPESAGVEAPTVTASPV